MESLAGSSKVREYIIKGPRSKKCRLRSEFGRADRGGGSNG